MLFGIRTPGWVPTFKAKFSLWIPNASNPIGSNTVCPWSRMNRPKTSLPVNA